MLIFKTNQLSGYKFLVNGYLVLDIRVNGKSVGLFNKYYACIKHY